MSSSRVVTQGIGLVRPGISCEVRSHCTPGEVATEALHFIAVSTSGQPRTGEAWRSGLMTAQADPSLSSSEHKGTMKKQAREEHVHTSLPVIFFLF